MPLEMIILEIIAYMLAWVIPLMWAQWMIQDPSRIAIIQKHRVFHPNTISYGRMLMAIPVIWLHSSGFVFAAIILFIIAAISDAIDGIFARGADLITDIGKIVDALGDKGLYLPILPYLFGFTSGIVLFICIDIFSQISRRWLKKKNKSTAANVWGKVKTTAVFILIGGQAISERYNLELWSELVDIGIYIIIVLAICSVFFKFISPKTIPAFIRLKKNQLIDYAFK